MGKRAGHLGDVHVAVPRDRIAAARIRLLSEGRSMTDLVLHALDEYAAGRVALPEPPSDSPSGG